MSHDLYAMIGTTLGRYKIMEELGHGGMSVVYRGVDTALDREVAIKLLHSHLARKEENRKRFHREARAIARLKHPNILEVYDFSESDDEEAFIVMEYVSGQTLRTLVNEHGCPPPEICAVIGQTMCDALAHAHEQGIIHRDIKPENVMLTHDGTLKVMDFGIAHVFDAETMTQTGSLMGSPGHMSPEMIEGERVDGRADVFAMGTVLYWLATGHLPFEGKTAPQILRRVLEGLFKNPESHDPRVGQHLGDIIRTCMAYEPDDRYASVEEAGAALARFAEGLGWAAPASELTAFLHDPTGYRDQFDASIVGLLTTRARHAMDAGQSGEAFRLLNRVLGYDPQNAGVRDMLTRLHRRAVPWRLVAAGVLVVGASAGGAWFAMEQLREKTPAQPAPPARLDARAGAIIRRHTAPTRLVDLTPARKAAQMRLYRATTTSSAASAAVVTARTTESARSLGRHLGGQARAVSEARDTLLASATRHRPRVRHALASRAPSRTNNARRKTTSASTIAGAGQAGRTNNTTTSETAPGQTNQAPTIPKTRYRFKLPPNAVVRIDGGPPLHGWQLNSKGAELTRGRHSLRVECPGRVPYRAVQMFDEARARTPVEIFPAWKPATIQITSNIRSAVHINDRPYQAPSDVYVMLEPARGKRFTRYEVRFPDAQAVAFKPREVIVQVRDAQNHRNLLKKTFRVSPGDPHIFKANFASLP